jgi:alkylhydroperoxidase/carboxymuconolactone decarboxylase family protein YurZ
MYARFKVVGIGLVIAGIAFAGVGGYTYLKTQEGAKALDAFSAAQNVTLTYNDQGQLTDRGKTEGAAAIMSLLTNDWGYTPSASELNPNDPVVNTASEYMYQMATIAFHTLGSTQTVVLPEDVTKDDGTVVKAGTYEVPVAGRYWSQFDRTDPLDGKARELAWTGTAHALIAELGVGSVTASALTMGLGIAAIAGALGLVLVLAGVGIIWAARPVTETVSEKATKRAAVPARI